MDYLERQQAREQEVARHNDLIQKTRHQLTLQEQKILHFLISKIKPDDTKFEEHTVRISDFCQLCGIHDEGGENHQHLKDTIRALASKNAWIPIEEGSRRKMLWQWVGKSVIDEQQGTFTIKLHECLDPYLFNLIRDKETGKVSGNYTKYELKYNLAMRSRYSARLYEILKSHLFKGMPVTYPLGELRQLLDAENHKLFANFKQHVLDPAKAELAEITDMEFDYEPIKTGRKVTAVKFHLMQKNTGGRLDAWAAIEKRLERKKKPGKAKPGTGQ